MKRLLSISLLLSVFSAACGARAATQTSAPAPRTLTVFAAASLTQAFGEIGRAFEAANSGVTVTFNFAGSQTLQTQIQQGAPVDVFASASGTNMDALVAGGTREQGCCTGLPDKRIGCDPAPVKPGERSVAARPV